MRLLLIFIVLSAIPILAVPVDSRKEAKALYDSSLRQDDVRAIETLQKARSLDPDNADIVYRIGFLYHKMNRLREAETYYNDVIEMHSCMEKAHNNLGSILLARNEVEKAAEHYTAAIRCNPGSVTAIYNLANIRSDQGQDSEAIELYKQAVNRA
ncbi:MAG: tetratricopeptide repeat protein, partial [Spirochaetia bacterium]|nr:tetratricopeptide repeat protein [Spirochaetia bacterium]